MLEWTNLVSQILKCTHAAQNDLAGIISVNKIINCGQIEAMIVFLYSRVLITIVC